MRNPIFARNLAIAVLVLCAHGIHTTAAQALAANSPLTPYASCQFSDGLQVVHTDFLPTNITSRTVDTDSGPRQIDLRAGMRVMFAYPDTDFYANVKVEELPASNYPELKRSLIGNFQLLSKGNIVNTAQVSPFKRFEVHGLDREKLEGGTLGIYLLFDDASHVVTTIYLLNQEPQSRKFQSMEEYRTLRAHFLAAYTDCVRENQKHPN